MGGETPIEIRIAHRPPAQRSQTGQRSQSVPLSGDMWRQPEAAPLWAPRGTENDGRAINSPASWTASSAATATSVGAMSATMSDRSLNLLSPDASQDGTVKDGSNPREEALPPWLLASAINGPPLSSYCILEDDHFPEVIRAKHRRPRNRSKKVSQNPSSSKLNDNTDSLETTTDSKQTTADSEQLTLDAAQPMSVPL